MKKILLMPIFLLLLTTYAFAVNNTMILVKESLIRTIMVSKKKILKYYMEV